MLSAKDQKQMSSALHMRSMALAGIAIIFSPCLAQATCFTRSDGSVDCQELEGGSSQPGSPISATIAAPIIVGPDVLYPGAYAISRGGNGSSSILLTGPSYVYNTPLGYLIGPTSGGAGGTVSVTANASIATANDMGYGIRAESYGGSGGATTIFASRPKEQDGRGGNINVFANNAITTFGSGASAIFVRGNGGTMTIANAGTLSTSGAAANGIDVLSTGLHQNSFENDGLGFTMNDIVVSNTGTIQADGAGASGIRAQSSNGDYVGFNGPHYRAGNIRISVTSGTVRGGSGAGSAGVQFVDGINNTLTNSGTITTLAGIDGNAVIGGTGSEAVENRGAIIGNIDLGTGTNSFINRSTAQLLSGTNIKLGTGMAFLNEGRLSPGGDNRVMKTTLTGNFTQSATGLLAFDLDLAKAGSGSEADRLSITGSATLSGGLLVHVLNPGALQSGSYSVPVLDATSLSGNVTVTTASPIVTLSTSQQANTLLLNYTVNFAPTAANLNTQEQAVATHLSSVQKLGGSQTSQAVVASLLAASDVSAIAAIYDQFDPSVLFGGRISTLLSAETFASTLINCGDLSAPQSGCSWARAQGVNRTFSGSGTTDYKDKGYSLSFGGERKVGDNLRIGGAVTYDESHPDYGSASSDGTDLHLGATARWSLADTDFALLASATAGSYRSSRLAGLARTTQHVQQTQVGIQAGRTFIVGKFEFTPALFAGGIRADWDNATDSDPMGLRALASQQTFWRLSPNVTLRSTWTLQAFTVQPYLRLGITQRLDKADLKIPATFADAPAGAEPFLTSLSLDRTLGEVNLGATLTSQNNFTLRLLFDGRYGNKTKENGLQLNIAKYF